MIVAGYTEKMKEYEELYKKNWGKDVDYTAIPSKITQEKLLKIMERICETGESILIGYEKLYINK